MTDTIEFFAAEVEQTRWEAARDTLADIRHRVFVEEQGVPESLELDDEDPGAVHWLARAPGGEPVATARLVGRKIGRMAVLAPYREKGIGSTLLRAIIRHGIREGMPELELAAQTRSEPFYSHNGFVVQGAEFMDAGIPHVPMVMDLGRFQQQRAAPAPPPVDESLRRRHTLESPEAFADAACRVASHSDRCLRIFSQSLDPLLYDREAFTRPVFELAVRHPYSHIWILVRDTEYLGKHFHQLVDIYHRLRTHIELRRLNEDMESQYTEFVTGDEQAVLYRESPRRYRGYLCLHSPPEARRLNADFDNLWIHSAPDPRVQRLHL